MVKGLKSYKYLKDKAGVLWEVNGLFRRLRESLRCHGYNINCGFVPLPSKTRATVMPPILEVGVKPELM